MEVYMGRIKTHYSNDKRQVHNKRSSGGSIRTHKGAGNK
jgi:hypothetical protein